MVREGTGRGGRTCADPVKKLTLENYARGFIWLLVWRFRLQEVAFDRVEASSTALFLGWEDKGLGLIRQW